MSRVSVAVLTVSDRCSRGEAEDASGRNLQRLVREGVVRGAEVVWTGVVADEQPLIEARLRELCDTLRVDVVLTTGGTGLAPRDVTPAATAAVLDKQLPGISGTILHRGLAVTPLAGLSQGIAGVRGSTLVINLAGSVKASQEGLQAVAGLVPHAVDLIKDDKAKVEAVHEAAAAVLSSKVSVCNVAGSVKASQEGLQAVAGLVPHAVDLIKDDKAKVEAVHEAAAAVLSSKVSVCNVASRARVSPYPLLAVEAAQDVILGLTRVIGRKVLTVNAAQALGSALAEDITAQEPLPPYPASIKDGYAVIAADGAGPRCVVAISSAGDALLGEKTLSPGMCARINTGAGVPAGADAVVQVEDTALLTMSQDGSEEMEIEIKEAPRVGQDIRPPGSDITVGEVVLPKGCYLGACELGVLATLGVTRVNVYRKPSVGVLSTGNELQEPGEQLSEGKIRDSNRTMLLSLLREEGFACLDLGIARDHPDALYTALVDAFNKADVVITTGSVSMGEKDYLKSVLIQDLNANILFGRVQMKPGKPTSCAQVNTSQVWFGLPGNPVSAFVTCHLFVLPALRDLAGYPSTLPTKATARLAETLTLDLRPEYRRAVLAGDSVSITGNQISSRLLSCVGANCLLQLPPRSDFRTQVHAGDTVNVLLTRK